MGREIDERVVQMKFEGGQFERGISKSIRSMNELKKGMDFDDAVKGFEKLDKSAKSLDMSHLSNSLDAVRVKFNLLDVMAFRVLDRIANKAIDTGTRMVRGLSIEQVSQGWIKFGDKTGAVQTIMAATAKQFTDTGEQMAYVNEQLDKLNWFTDETSYNFVDMVNNIGKFTSNNIALDASVTAMQGIANWAAISGANANEASRAMYNISQALSSGAVRLEDWMSIENANMGTAAFKELAMQMALTVGTLKKQGDKIVTINKGVEVSVEKFRNTLTEDAWLNKDVLMATLNQYGQATNKLNNYIQELWDSGSDLLTSDLVTGIDAYVTGAKTAEEISEEWGLSLEKTSEILEDFNNETDKFGLQAFKAAQEAKTFEDAINSVKDAVSTGWMKSFEIIFGNYLEAKEFFTDLANVLYDIFAGGTEARNTMLQEWKNFGGRDMMIDSIWNTLSAIMNILNPIKAAWNDIFGEMSSVRLFNLTARIWRLIDALAELAENNAPKLQRTFRGVFAVLDMIRMLLGGAFKIVLETIREIFGDFNLDVFEFTGNIGDSIVAIRDWMKEGKRFDKVIDQIIDTIKSAIANVRSFINTIKEFGPVKAILDSFHQIFTEDFRGIDSIIQFTGGLLSSFWALLMSVPKMTSLSDIGDAFGNFGESAVENLRNVGISFEGLNKLGETVFGELAKILENVTGGFKGAASSAGSAIDVLSGAMNKVDWDAVIIMATGVAILALAWKIADSVAVIAKSLTKVTDVAKSFKGMTDSISGYFKALKENIQSNNILKIAISIGILAAAFYALAKLDAGALGIAAVAMVVMTGAIAGLLIVMEKTGKEKVGGQGAYKFAGVIISFAAAVYLIAKSLNDINLEQVIPRLGVLVAIMGAILGVTYILNRGTAVARVGAGIGMYIGVALAIYALIGALKKISDLGAEDLFMAVPILGALMTVLGLFIRLSSKTYIISKDKKAKTIGSIGSALAIALSMHLLIGAIKKLGNMDPEVLVKGLIGMGGVLLEFGVLMGTARVAGQNANKAGGMILYISIALNLLVPALRKLGELDEGTLAKGIIVVALIQKLMKGLIKASKESGEHAAKAGLMILAFAGALMAIQLVVKTLGKVDLATLSKGVISVSAIILALGQVLKNAGGNFNVETTKSIVKLTVIIGILGALVIALSFIKPERVLSSTLGLSTVILALGESMKLMSKVELPSIKDVAKLYGMIALLGLAIGAIAYFTDPYSVLATATGLSEVLLAVGVSAQLIGKSKAPTEKQAESWVKFVKSAGGVIVALSIVVAAANYFGSSMDGILEVTTGMSEVLISLGIAGRIMDKQKNPSVYNTRAMTEWVTSVGILIVALAGVQAFINRIGGSTDGILTLTTAMSEIIIALGVASRVMGQNGGDFKINLGGMATMVGAISVIGLILASFSNFTDPTKVIPLATGLSAVMIALAGTLKIMSTMRGSMSNLGESVGMFTILSIITGILGAVIAGLSNIVNPEGVVPIALSLSAVLLALSVVVKILNTIPPAFMTGAWSALGMMGVIVGVLGALTLALGALMQLPGFQKILSDGGEAMMLFGRAIGGFFGGVVGGLAEGVMTALPGIGTSLSKFMENAQYFFDSVATIPDGLALKVAEIAGALIALGAADLITAVLNFASSLFGDESADLSTKFETFGKALRAFSDALGEDFDASQVQQAAKAGQALSDLENSLPRQGGKLQEWLGQKDLASFGFRLTMFGVGIKNFGIAVEGLNTEDIEAAAAAGKSLSDLENSLPSQGGKLQEWLGQKDLAGFGQRLVVFGVGIKAFSVVVKGLDEAAINAAHAAGVMMADLERNLPSQDGLLQTILGSQNIGDFGTRLFQFGLGLKLFSGTVVGLDIEAIQLATEAAKALVEMEKSVDNSGGWGELFTGKSDFASFGDNLSQLGEGLKSYNTSISAITLDKISAVTAELQSLITLAKNPDTVFERIKTMGAAIKDYAPSVGVLSSNCSTADVDAMADVTDEIERLLKLSELTSATQWITDMVSHAGTMITKLTSSIEDKKTKLNMTGRNIAYWLIKGLETGVGMYEYLTSAAASKIANKVIDKVESELGIASPSTVMIEEGKWIVKGLAEGITGDMSAEDAAAKKASNIVSAFQKGLEKLDLLANQRQLKYDIWGLTEGAGATDEEKQQKELELKVKTLEDAAQTAQVQNAAFETAKQTFAEGTKEYIEAENRMLESFKKMYEIKNEIDQIQNELFGSSGMDNLRSKNDEYIKFIKDNEEAYKMLGWSTEQLIEDAKKKTGFGMETQETEKFDTQALIDKALGTQQIQIVQEPVKKAVKKAVSQGVAQGTQEGLTEGTEAGAEKYFNNMLNTSDDSILGMNFKGMDRLSSSFKDTFMSEGETAVKNLSDGMSNAAKTYGPTVSNVLGDYLGDAPINMLNKRAEINSPSKRTYQTGVFVAQGLINGVLSKQTESANTARDLGTATMDGLTKGINERGQQAIAAAKAVADAVAAQMRRALQVRSPSRITRAIGNYVDMGLALGLRENIGNVEAASQEVANSTLTALDYMKDQINTIVESDDDFAPTITPVLNLDDLKKQGKDISRSFGRSGIDLQGARLQVGSIADQTAYGQNGSNKGGTQTNYNFTQNNYSPKALSRTEIYRQTRNEFARLKGASQR